MSSKKSPTAAKFFLAEDIRMEAGGKPLLIGLYANDEVIVDLPPDAPEASQEHPVLLSELAVLAAFPDVEGKFVGKLSLTDPSGKMILETGQGEFQSERGGMLNIVSRFRPLAFESFGQFKLAVELDGMLFEYTFAIEKNATAA